MLYYIVVPILYFFAYWPTALLYRLADVLAFVLHRLVRYRYKVVMDNLRGAFPDKTEIELSEIAKLSYTHLADRVVENIKCVTISVTEIQDRVTVENIELMHELYALNRHVVIMVAHTGSWEFGGYKASAILKHKVYGIVSLVKNQRFNHLIQSTRGKMGMYLVTMQDAKQLFESEFKQPSAFIFIADQSPSNPAAAHWVNFMNRETAFFTGGERFARQHNAAVVFVNMVQQSRGHYLIKLIEITRTPNAESFGSITNKYAALVQNQLMENPADWLWSHKRWKHKRQA